MTAQTATIWQIDGGMATVHPQTIRFAALEACDLTRPSARAILAVLLHAMNHDTLTARMAKKTLKRLTGINSNRTYNEALNLLKEAGDIAVVEYANGGRGRSPIWTFPRAWTYLQEKETALESRAELEETALESRAEKTALETRAVSAKPPYFLSETALETRAPTLIQKYERSGAGRAASGINHGEGWVWEGIRQRFGEDAQKAWLSRIELLELNGGVVRLAATGKFEASYVQENFGPQILAYWRQLDHDIYRIEVTA